MITQIFFLTLPLTYTFFTTFVIFVTCKTKTFPRSLFIGTFGHIVYQINLFRISNITIFASLFNSATDTATLCPGVWWWEGSRWISVAEVYAGNLGKCDKVLDREKWAEASLRKIFSEKNQQSQNKSPGISIEKFGLEKALVTRKGALWIYTCEGRRIAYSCVIDGHNLETRS